MGFWNTIFPKEKDFYGMLVKQAFITLEGVEFLYKFLSNPKDNPIQTIVNIEHQGDFQRRLLIDDLNKTFITPIDREDLFGLSRTIDDILDLSKSAIEEFTIYNLSSNEHLIKIVYTIRDGVGYLHDAISLLKEHPAISIEKCVACKDCVDDIEIMYYNSLKDLAEAEDIKYMFKMREIYKHLLDISFKITDSANIILDIIVKTT